MDNSAALEILNIIDRVKYYGYVPTSQELIEMLETIDREHESAITSMFSQSEVDPFKGLTPEQARRKIKPV